MKIQIRRGVFETNSSSVHSLCICSKDDYDRWKNGELFYKYFSDKLVEDSTEVQQNREDYLKHESCNDYMTYEEFQNYVNKYYETYEERYIHKSGDEIVVFGYYGHD